MSVFRRKLELEMRKTSTTVVTCGTQGCHKSLIVPTFTRTNPDGSPDPCVYFNFKVGVGGWTNEYDAIQSEYRNGMVFTLGEGGARQQLSDRYADGGIVVPEFGGSIVWMCQVCLGAENQARLTNPVLPSKNQGW